MPAGIDLGTVFSTIARTDERGIPGLVGDAQDSSRFVTTSAVTLLPDSAVVGLDGPDDAAVIAREVKSMLGDEGHPVVDGSGRRWTGEELCALLLRKLVHDAASGAAGEMGPAILTMPARFMEAPRRGLRKAATIAGLAECRFVEDGVACAALHSPVRAVADEVVLVCDAGYAGFTATLLASSPSGLYVVANQFTPLAGTRAMDLAIAHVFEQQFAALHGGGSRSEPEGQLAWQRLGEYFRSELSRPGSTVVARTALLEGRAIDLALSRTQFERVLRPALEGAEATIERCLAGAALPRSAVQRVVLAGGGAHTSALRRRVALATERRAEVLRGIDPQHAAALGAASLGLRRAVGERGDALVVRQVAPFDLACRVLNGPPGPSRPDVLIPKNTPLPAKQSRTFTAVRPNQRFLEVELIQSDGPDDPGVSAGVLSFGPIDRPTANCPIEVWLGYDEEGFVVASASGARSGRPIGHGIVIDLPPGGGADSHGRFARLVQAEH